MTIAFGLRNVTPQGSRAGRGMRRVLKVGGAPLVLEFSAPERAAQGGPYDWYSFNVLPKLGASIAGDAEATSISR